MKEIINGSITSPKGFKAAGISAGLKRSGKKDLSLIYSEHPACFAGAFTSNKLCASSVDYCKNIVNTSEKIQAIAINSGNANACTGDQGMADTELMAAKVAECLNIGVNQVMISSTGVIGVPLPIDKISSGLKQASESLSDDGGIDAARAIMTTDTVPKSIAVNIDIGGCRVTIGGIAKGSGMIAPKMELARPHATMLAYITTDAAIHSDCLRKILHDSLPRSFNKITVDGDTSTNDTFIALANGAAGNPMIATGSAEADLFSEAFDFVSKDLAKKIVLDGEGATKFVNVKVKSARTESEARQCAFTIANSLLCKTAWFGADPNWGRILDAVGYSEIEIDAKNIIVYYDDLLIVKDSTGTSTPIADQIEVLKQNEFNITVDVGAGNSEFSVWTCDLSYDYVKINAEYHT